MSQLDYGRHTNGVRYSVRENELMPEVFESKHRSVYIIDVY